MTHTGIILAAGRGSRMKSDLPKALQPLGSGTMIEHLMAETRDAFDRFVVVIAPDMFELRAILENGDFPVQIAVQDTPKGTGHAAYAGLELCADDEEIVVLYADNPLLTADTVRNLRDAKSRTSSDLGLVAMRAPENQSYGRVILNGDKVAKIVEYKEANTEEKSVDLCNGGVLSGNASILKKHLASLIKKADGSDKEIYLTDLIDLYNRDGKDVCYVETDESEMIGVNSRLDLAIAEEHLQNRLRKRALEQGVTLKGRDTVFLSRDTQWGRDVIVEPHVVIGKNVRIHDRAHIKAFSHLEDCMVGEEAVVGPYARLRPGTDLGKKTRVGNFVEIKNSRIDDQSKVNHLSYIGDSSVGMKTNIGAGTITCNYDGVYKHRTTIGNNVFVGSHTTLIAPINVGDNSLIAAGSLVTRNVEAGDMAIARTPQTNKPGLGKRWTSRTK